MRFKNYFLRLSLLVFCVVFASASLALPNNTAAFMSISDIHFDPFLACQNVSPCPLINELENSPASQWHTILAMMDTSKPQYKQDSNFVLLESALSEFKHTADLTHPKFVLVLGDMLAHAYLDKYQEFSADKSAAGYQEFVKKTEAFLAFEFAATFPTQDVYRAVGNNDSYQGDYVSDVRGAFFKDTGLNWSALIKDQTNRASMLHDFINAGYYAVTIQSDVRLLVLNTNLFAVKAKGDLNTAALLELEWLHQQLVTAGRMHQQVLIAMHIPAGIDVYNTLKTSQVVDFWTTDYTQRFVAELKEHAQNIMGILPAHLHSDFFQILDHGYSKAIPISATPSISAVNGNNPAFKVFRINTDALQLQDYSVIFDALNTDPGWNQEYDFNDVYQPGCKNCQLVTGMQLLSPGPSPLVTSYQDFYDTQMHSSSITAKYHPYYWCQVKALTQVDYQSCLTTLHT
jgi:sphingomyelin phosphodiesterase acid-like 3